MRRLLPAFALLAAVAAVVSQPTYSTFSETRANSATWQAQSAFPPLNTAVPTITSSTVVITTTLTGHLGSWAITHPATTTYAMQWQRCTGGVCADIPGSSLIVSSLASTLGYVVLGADSGKTLRLKITATDSAITAPGERASTVVYSAEVPG